MRPGYGAFLHRREMFPADQPGGLGTGDEDGADYQIGFLQSVFDVGLGTVESDDSRAEDVVQIGQAPGVHVEDGDVGSDTDGDFAHRHQAGQGLVVFDGFIGNGFHLSLQKGVGEFSLGGDVLLVGIVPRCVAVRP